MTPDNPAEKNKRGKSINQSTGPNMVGWPATKPNPDSYHDVNKEKDPKSNFIIKIEDGYSQNKKWK